MLLAQTTGETGGSQEEMLRTIQVPVNLSQLAKVLPKSKYSTQKRPVSHKVERATAKVETQSRQGSLRGSVLEQSEPKGSLSSRPSSQPNAQLSLQA